jgi:hypothetical protein
MLISAVSHFSIFLFDIFRIFLFVDVRVHVIYGDILRTLRLFVVLLLLWLVLIQLQLIQYFKELMHVTLKKSEIYF